MIGWLIILAVVVLLLLMPCGIYASYNSGTTELKLIVGFLRINLLRPSKKQGKKTKKKKFESHEQVKEKKNIRDFWPIVNLVLELLSDFRRKLSIQDLQFRLTLGGSDPYDLSLNYGRYWVALGNLMPHLESWFTIRRRNLEIACDYTSTDTKIDASIDLRLSFAVLLRMALYHGFRIFVKYYKITKDGAVS